MNPKFAKIGKVTSAIENCSPDDDCVYFVESQTEPGLVRFFSKTR